MKITKIVLSAIVILFAGLGLFKILSFDIANPVMLTALATFLLLQSAEYKDSKRKADCILTVCRGGALCLRGCGLQCLYGVKA